MSARRVSPLTPPYRPAQLDAPAQQACSSTGQNDDGSKLGNRRFLRFNVPGAQPVTLRAATPGDVCMNVTISSS